MAIVVKTRGRIKKVTSSYFKDLSYLRNSEYETDYRSMNKNGDFNTEKLKLAYVVQKLILFKKGCREVTDYVNRLPNSQLETTRTEYIGEDLV